VEPGFAPLGADGQYSTDGLGFFTSVLSQLVEAK
jgi:hypothetical protein